MPMTTTSCPATASPGPRRPSPPVPRPPRRRPPRRSPPRWPAKLPRRPRTRPPRSDVGRPELPHREPAPSGSRRPHPNETGAPTLMADISAELVKELRERTGAGFMDCKKALVETDGDLDKAIALLRERGVAQAAKKAGRDAREGLIGTYIHTGGRFGALIEVNCETDFVARNEQFQQLVKDLAIQVVALKPLYPTIESI